MSLRLVASRGAASGGAEISFLEKNVREGENPVLALRFVVHVRYAFIESRSSGFERKMCDKFHIKLNIGARPIANKYREGKMKSSLERELKVPEIAGKEAIGTCFIPMSEAGVALIPLLFPLFYGWEGRGWH